ncbi:FAD/FMN-containing dehydrogenase [Geosmithia morbida]|uniref:FAD/FMN-containing dehydrogenase n=1 Tax=Geosmithia morbida TaxID=1094350 RepID=A0A9P5D326_9HYPO|nr:FAD/FMN-containing dehydrogenase [Geosmithia morbida]KAF4121385.1 FAD/FMN-containing dehydrogenase [Geosmithia morbida]
MVFPISFRRALWASAAALGAAAAADPTASTTGACDELASSLPDRVWTEPSVEYLSESNAYWSTALRGLKPACIVLPRSVEEVSVAVKVLGSHPDVQFAVKSGGHTPNQRHSTVLDGVLISTKHLSGVTYRPDEQLAYVKPGGDWNDVIGSLEEHGVTIVGGRLGIVGVAGYLLQGGISFLSAQYGLAADNIVAWEMVAANGTILNVKASENPDLAVALRGSGSQLGIVTQFTVKTHEIGQVWGGLRTYGDDKADEIFAALHGYVPGGVEDTKSAIILTNTMTAGVTKSFIIYYFYDGPEPPTTGAFAKFLDIDSVIDVTSTRSYSDLLNANGAAAELLVSRISFRTYTIPYLPDVPGMFSEISEKFSSLLADHLSSRPTALCSADFQPFPSVIGQHSQDSGGNAMGISGRDPHRIILELQCAWDSETDDDIFQGASRDMVRWLEAKVADWTFDGEEPYLPLFMNDAAWDQNVTGTYSRYAEFKQIQKAVDPTGFFPTRGGGFVY